MLLLMFRRRLEQPLADEMGDDEGGCSDKPVEGTLSEERTQPGVRCGIGDRAPNEETTDGTEERESRTGGGPKSGKD